MLPVPVEFVVVLALAASILSWLCLAYAVGADADARDANGLAWGLFAFVLPPFTVVVYLAYRTRLPERSEPADRLERWVGTVGIGIVSAYAAAAVVSPPDPISLLVFGLPLAAVAVPAAYVLCYEPGWRVIAS